jgi:formylglycine-generating enzyme
MGISDERNGNPLIVPRIGTRARVPKNSNTSTGGEIAATTPASLPSIFVLNRSVSFAIVGSLKLGLLNFISTGDNAAIFSVKIGEEMMAAHQVHPAPVAHVEPSMVSILEGWFLMGSNSGQDCERPIHRVWVDRFQLAATQVTNAEYQHFLRATGSKHPTFWSDPNFKDPAQPVAGVSWFQADQYCQWLGAQTSRIYRLPTEAEWERAARGGLEQTNFPWGDEPPQSLPDYATRWQTGPEPVARYAPNAFGLYNMCDNVHEWCSDWYDPDYYSVSLDRNPHGPELGPGKGQRKASRGGSWRHHVKVMRCSARSSIPPEFQYADYGFRVAANV